MLFAGILCHVRGLIQLISRLASTNLWFCRDLVINQSVTQMKILNWCLRKMKSQGSTNLLKFLKDIHPTNDDKKWQLQFHGGARRKIRSGGLLLSGRWMWHSGKLTGDRTSDWECSVIAKNELRCFMSDLNRVFFCQHRCDTLWQRK